MLALGRVVIHAFDLEYPGQVVVLQHGFSRDKNKKPEIRNLI